MFMDVCHRSRVLKLTECLCLRNTNSAQAKYRALRASGWERFAFHIKYKIRMRLDLVAHDG